AQACCARVRRQAGGNACVGHEAEYSNKPHAGLPADSLREVALQVRVWWLQKQQIVGVTGANDSINNRCA
ncbi:MAG: hypothetical protein AAF991_09990, partial [Pseudomonadota bacterium]